MDEPSESELLFSSDHNHLTLKRKPKRERRAKTLQKFPCFECEYAATTRRLLKEHIESKHEVVVYPCVQCDYSATTAKNLRSHVECKHEGVRYPCLQCEYISNGRSDLRKHVRNKHEGVRYPCHICTYAATRPGDLKRHMERKHKGETSFYKKENLKINILVDRYCYLLIVKIVIITLIPYFYLLYIHLNFTGNFLVNPNNTVESELYTIIPETETTKAETEIKFELKSKF